MKVRRATYGDIQRILEVCEEAKSIMRHCIEKAGFRYCGIIYLKSGDERLAFQKI